MLDRNVFLPGDRGLSSALGKANLRRQMIGPSAQPAGPLFGPVPHGAGRSADPNVTKKPTNKIAHFARAAQVVAPLSLLASACVFHTPPALPEELVAQEVAVAEDPVPGATEAQEPPTGASEESEAAAYKKGEPPPVGMTDDELRRFNEVQGDPIPGPFALADALAGLSGPEDGTLWADFYTARGVIACELFEERTPNTVANFVALARGLRPVFDTDNDRWAPRRYYDDTIFHRVIPGFILQGGDPTGTGMGNPGYVIVDEYISDLRHDRPGVLSMANRGGPTTGSAQFFITLGPAPNLDSVHTIFGQCDEAGVEVADTMASTLRDDDDRPIEDEGLKKIEILRRAPG